MIETLIYTKLFDGLGHRCISVLPSRPCHNVERELYMENPSCKQRGGGGGGLGAEWKSIVKATK